MLLESRNMQFRGIKSFFSSSSNEESQHEGIDEDSRSSSMGASLGTLGMSKTMDNFEEMFGITDWDEEPKTLDEFFRREAITREYEERIGYLESQEEIEERKLAGEGALNRT